MTSDNVFAAQQMNSTAHNWGQQLGSLLSQNDLYSYPSRPLSLVGPQGCHIELDQSVECYIFTAAHWFVLALSDVIVAQSFGELNAPTSSFSRYAGLYGLKRGPPPLSPPSPSSGQSQSEAQHLHPVTTPFRSAKYCDDFYSTKLVSRVAQGNWFC